MDHQEQTESKSAALRSMGIRTWLGAAMFGVQTLGTLLPLAIVAKLVGMIFGIHFLEDLTWWTIFFIPVNVAFVAFIALAVHAEVHRIADSNPK